MSIGAVRRACGMFVASVVATAAFAVVMPGEALAANGDDAVTSSEVAGALNGADDKSDALIAESVGSVADSDSAAVASVDGATVDIPKNPDDGVTIETNGVTVTVELPGAEDASDAKRLSDGTVVYPGSDGAANAVIPTSDGVQMITTIANKDAPSSYEYKVSVPTGGKIQLVDGGAVVLDANGNPVVTVPAPWARDANGVTVPSHFETDGSTLTQVVDHASGSYSYPVVADPWWSWIWGLVKVTVKKIGPWAWVLCATGAGWAWYRSDSQGWLRVGDAAAGCFL